MSKYTTELRYLLEMDGFTLALDSYPIFDEEYRATLNARITDHYYFNEIGQETPDRFNHFLRARMNEIMPRFNKLYLSEAVIVDPLQTTNIAETTIRDTTGSTLGSAATSASKGKQKTVMMDNDTPQGSSTIANIEAGGYASKVSIAEQTSPTPETATQESEGSASSSEESSRSMIGYQAISQADELDKYRRTLLNIDRMVIDALADLFMQIY